MDARDLTAAEVALARRVITDALTEARDRAERLGAGRRRNQVHQWLTAWSTRGDLDEQALPVVLRFAVREQGALVDRIMRGRPVDQADLDAARHKVDVVRAYLRRVEPPAPRRGE
ncbi:hypothetical protein LX15_003495 [Streptoalloteichus tenebrarius]|uniref:Uncharacterized protein n=1 Tax=Streptoalloteichus tenebrarius (strain ATCC 17920 / DSM 40477 / JCM 4838 / CBS 697.72 / NBRC 16177 / NCIMB 11028 / NRRL B-12390 / A12253. 1 / ISP 5477) TaxID=1933 RepID=A0ABT1HW88_STRSD|nr:hypothetical protein [Streptoalloteichus tenebrarius]MCP2259786.1 hypothetical protein [Streptoalloteichus tenebrarius]BFE99268.1 hypothetical protein GCM10020241_09440 [Streptoalloteichus tenebrarius]